MIYMLEDDANIRNFVLYALNNSGLEAKGFERPSEFWAALKEETPSVLLLDIMLPEEDGMQVLAKLRSNPEYAGLPVIMLTAKGSEYDKVIGLDSGADDYVAKPFGTMELISRIKALLRRTSSQETKEYEVGGLYVNTSKHIVRVNGNEVQLPVIMLTAKGSEYDKVIGLDSGADDYVAKPFGTMELISRIKALLRRTSSQETKEYEVGGLYVNTSKHIVRVNGNEVQLTFKEFELLCYLLENIGTVLSREKIITKVWGYDFDGESRTVDVHIRTLRMKLGDCGGMIETVRGIGYKAVDIT